MNRCLRSVIPGQFVVLCAVTVFSAALVGGGKAYGQAVGLCLHADHPEAAGSTVQAFEYVRAIQFQNETRFQLPDGRTRTISKFRYRGVVAYPTNLRADNPELFQFRESYPALIAEYPATRPYLEPLLVRIQGILRESEMRLEATVNAARVAIGGLVYRNPEYGGMADGQLVVKHLGGVAKIDRDKLGERDVESIRSLGRPEKELRVDLISGRVLINAIFSRLTGDGVVFKDDGGEVEFQRDKLAARDLEVIEGLSDGTWALGEPGFRDWSSEKGCYGSVLFLSGRQMKEVKIDGIEGEQVRLVGADREEKISIDDLFSLPGVTEEDASTISGWGRDVLAARLEGAEPTSRQTEWRKRERRGRLTVVGATAKVLQVLNGEDGVLATDLRGAVLMGTRERDVISEVSAVDPATGRTVVKEIQRRMESQDIVENGFQGLVFISGDVSGVVDGQTLRQELLTHTGTFNYIDRTGTERTLMKFSVE